MRVDDAAYEVEPQPAARNLSRNCLASPVERLEDVLAIVSGDAQAAILDGDTQAVTALWQTRESSAHPPRISRRCR